MRSDIHDIRYTIPGDARFLFDWLQTPGILHGFPFSAGKELETAVQGWMSFVQASSSLTAIVDQEPCGIGTLFLMPYRKVAHECLFQLIVAPKWQRSGIGTSLVKNLLHLAKSHFRLEWIFVEIIENSPLQSILHHFGFYLVARQERYFKEEGKYFARLVFEIDLQKVVFRD